MPFNARSSKSGGTAGNPEACSAPADWSGFSASSGSASDPVSGSASRTTCAVYQGSSSPRAGSRFKPKDSLRSSKGELEVMKSLTGHDASA